MKRLILTMIAIIVMIVTSCLTINLASAQGDVYQENENRDYIDLGVVGDIPCSGVIVHRFYPGPVGCDMAEFQTLVDIYEVGTGKIEANTLCGNAGGIRVVLTNLNNRKGCWDRDT